MIVPLLVLLLLVSMVSRTAKKFQVSSTVPVAVSAGVYLLFAVLSRGMIKVRSEREIAGAFVLGLLLYAAVAAALYGLAYALIRQESRRKQGTAPAGPAAAGTCASCGAPVADGAAFCAACGSPREGTSTR